MHTFETIRAFKRCDTKINEVILCYTVKLKSCLAIWKIKRFFYKRMENVHTEVLCRKLKKIKIEYLRLQFLLDVHAKEFWSSLVPFYFQMMKDMLHDTIMIQQYIWKCSMGQYDKFWRSALFSHDDTYGFILVQM